MDIEGAEIEAERGMEEILKNDPKLAIETHSVNGNSTYKVIRPKLREKGYEVHMKSRIVYGRKRKA